jgi:predicted nucleotidyltransferase
MAAAFLPELSLLTDGERSCLARYLDILAETLQNNLHEIVVFGSVARGETWPRGMPIRSDLDVLVVTDAPLSDKEVADLIDATLSLFLECGRQIAPQFRTRDQLAASDERTAAFRENVAQDGVTVFRL